MAQDAGLAEMVNSQISIVTNDGKNIVGVLRGYDQHSNLIVANCHERVYSTATGVEKYDLGLYLVRGDNIAVVGEVDEQLDASIDLAQIRAIPLKPVYH